MRDAVLLRAVHGAYRLSLGPAWRRFTRAALACARTQESRLLELAAANDATAYGRAHRFVDVRSVRDWQQLVPLVSYDELEPWIDRAARGERAVLTAAPIRVFERSGGSTAPNKLIPYTGALLAEFAAATGPWLYDLFTRHAMLRGTRSYWSISPATRRSEMTAGGTPIGFDDDTEYFGPIARHALRRMMAVPPDVARLRDLDEWRLTTAQHLVGAADLGLISVWHPSFLTLLMQAIEAHLDALLDATAPSRAAEIRARLGAHPLGEAIWPQLALISCWTDAAAADALPALRHYFPRTPIQGKGLLATEGVVSFPVLNGPPQPASHAVAAIASHFLEFIDLDHPTRTPSLAHELRSGATYAPVLSTGGGLYRYRLGDAVRCTGYWAQAPLLRFEGRIDQTSDMRGEKVSVRHVDSALAHAQHAAGARLDFALLAPLRSGLPHYVLFAESSSDDSRLSVLAGELERSLAESHSYRYARQLGQLGPLAVVRVTDAAATYERALVAAGRRAGEIKPVHLDTRLPWQEIFKGRGVDTQQPFATAGR